jgi:uncharacterized protein YegL
VRIAIAIGRDADINVLEQFTNNKELVLEAKNPQLLVKFIKWASTVVKNVSAPKMDASNGSAPMDMSAIPTASVDDDEIW